MDATFETWAMRGLVVGLLGIVLTFVWREIISKDNIWRTVTTNREQQEKALAETRREFTESLDRITAQFRTALDALNVTMASLAVTVGNLNTTMAREYASKEDLREVKTDLQADLLCHMENCPMKFNGR